MKTNAETDTYNDLYNVYLTEKVSNKSTVARELHDLHFLGPKELRKAMINK